jgi:Rrn6, beta-propeller
MSEVGILSYRPARSNRPSLDLVLSLPIPFLINTSAKFVSDVTFDSTGTRIALISNQGHWILFELDYKSISAAIVASGSIEFSLMDFEVRRPWWKLYWMNRANDILVAESRSLHMFNVEVAPRGIGTESVFEVTGIVET